MRRRVLDDGRDDAGEPWTTAHRLSTPVTGERPTPTTGETVTGAALVSALNRVADSFEKVVESLDNDRRERRARLDDVDALLRELVIALRPPTSVPPVVVGGSIDPSVEEQIDLSQADIALDPGR